MTDTKKYLPLRKDGTGWILEKDYFSKGRKKIFNGWIATLVKNDKQLDIIRSWTKKSLIEEIHHKYPYQ